MRFFEDDLYAMRPSSFKYRKRIQSPVKEWTRRCETIRRKRDDFLTRVARILFPFPFSSGYNVEGFVGRKDARRFRRSFESRIASSFE